MPKLSEEQERELLARAKRDDQEAKKQLIEIHERLVRGMANDICKRHDCMDLLEDFISEGKRVLLKKISKSEGKRVLLKKISKFDPNRGVRFSTFVYLRIDGAMRDYLWRNRYKDIYGSRAKWEFARDVRLAHDELMSELSEKPAVEMIAEYMTVSVSEVETVLSLKERLLASEFEVDAKSVATQTGLPFWKARRILNKHSDIKGKSKSSYIPAESIAEKLRVTPQAVDEALDLATYREPGERENRFVDVAADTLAPDELAANNERNERLHRAIQGLPDEVRQVIILHHFEGKTMEEISEITGININTVKSHARRGRNKLKLCLQDGGVQNA